ncbi:MAG: hypothetical protein QXS93_03390 [Candidatus Micrarchaeia archaeon]
MSSFDELRKRIVELEKIASTPTFKPPAGPAKSGVEIRHLSFYDVRNELDKLYKVRAAKKYLK